MNIVDDMFYEGSIHLIAGPTGAGKTRWLLEALQEWEQSLPVLGCASHPCPWIYVSADRQQSEVDRTIKSLGLTMKVPTMLAFGVMPPIGAMGILEKAEQRGAELIVWEGFGKYVEGNARSVEVSRWLNWMTWRLSHKQDGTPRGAPLTIIGVMEEPKMKPRDKYPNPRQRVSGPAAWGHCCDTIIVIEPENEKKPTDPRRHMYVCNHSGAPMEFKATLATGHFRVIP